MNNKIKAVLIFLMIIVVSGAAVWGIKKYNIYKIEENRLKKIAITKDAIKLYINTADEVGKNKIQLNWKEIAAVSAIQENNYFTKMDSGKVEVLAEKYIIVKDISGKEYFGTKSLDQITTELNFTSKEKQRAQNYYNQLENMGLYPENFSEKNIKFIETIEPYAYEIYEKYGILPSVVAAQSIIESGWGNYAEINNYFGIKADASWNGKSKYMVTTEFNGTVIKDKFRVYNSIEESFIDYGEFLKNNPRYTAAGVFQAKNYSDMAHAIEKGGYSTHQNSSGEKVYADYIISVIKANNLMILDNIAENRKFMNLQE